MKFAILESGGKQYRAVEGGAIEVDRLPVEPGADIKLEQVLLLADDEKITVGTPIVKDTPVWARVVAHFKGPKVVIFNYRAKKRIRVKTGHRQNYTRLLVEQIGGKELAPSSKPESAVRVQKEKPVKAEKPARTEEPKEPEAVPEVPKVEKKPTRAASPKTTAPAKKPAKAAPTKPAPKKPSPRKPATKKPAEKASKK
jgi:large subunit ribosomal protein L21